MSAQLGEFSVLAVGVFVGCDTQTCTASVRVWDPRVKCSRPGVLLHASVGTYKSLMAVLYAISSRSLAIRVADVCHFVPKSYTYWIVPDCTGPSVCCVHANCAEQTMWAWQDTHPQVQRFGEPLPTFEAFKAKSAQMRSKTVQDVWALMLTSVPGKPVLSSNSLVYLVHLCK